MARVVDCTLQVVCDCVHQMYVECLEHWKDVVTEALRAMSICYIIILHSHCRTSAYTLRHVGRIYRLKTIHPYTQT